MIGWFKKKRKTVPTDAPHFIRDYIEKYDLPLPLQKFVVIDLETTGLNPKLDRILSFGLVPMSQREIDIGHILEGTLNDEQAESNINASEVHHLTKADLSLGFSPENFAESLLNTIENRIIVGHHVAFDLKCLNHFFETHFGIKLYNKTLDTAQLAARLNNPHGTDYSFKPGLDEVCAIYNITPELRHTAGGDAFTTALLLMKLLNHARERGLKDFGVKLY
jgi:DNA polymerase-3 subunit epsilon